MKNILVIGEKSSQVKKFKDVLLQNTVSRQEAKMVYSYTGIWRASLGVYNVTMIPLTGHISKIDTPEKYGWGKVAPIQIVKDPKALVFKDDYKYKQVLRKNAPNFDELFIATDPDSEGDNIGYEAYNILIKANPKLKTNVKRVWNASLTRNEIIRAFTETESRPNGWDTKLALSVQGRQIADAWLGFAGTREITIAARKVLPIKVFSVGRVQLPTLKMIVDRDLEHESFVPKPLWNLQAKLETKNKETFTAAHQKNPFVNEEEINNLYKKLRPLKTGTVLKVEKNRIHRKPPAPLNTTAALSLLARRFKLKAEKALNILSDLYLEGLLSYPRTENARFNDNFPHNDILSKLKGNSDYGLMINKIGPSVKQVRTNGLKKGVEDHDPIHPTGEMVTKESTKITKLHLEVLELLSKYYIGMFMNDLVIDKVKVEITIGDEIFNSEGKTVIAEGWTEAISWQKIKDEVLPNLTNQDQVTIKELKKIKSQTKPKPRYSDAIILRQMERLGLGTKSSRPSILEKLVSRGYIIRKKTQIISQPSGRALIQVLEPIWPDIVTNTFTKNVEAKMDEVARGNTTYQGMLDQLRQQYIKQHELLIENIPKLLKQLQSIDSSLLNVNLASSKKLLTKTTKNREKSDIKGNRTILTDNKKICPSCKKRRGIIYPEKKI
jgi:DNA topoisomerase-1